MSRLELININGYIMRAWEGFSKYSVLCDYDDMPTMIILDFEQYNTVIFLDKFIGLADMLVWNDGKLIWSNDYL